MINNQFKFCTVLHDELSQLGASNQAKAGPKLDLLKFYVAKRTGLRITYPSSEWNA